jgi:hypothetical protein
VIKSCHVCCCTLLLCLGSLKYFFFYYDNTELREVREVAVGKNGINEDDDDDPMNQKPKAKGD